ncbi:MAG: hypothetical protein ABEL04_05150 [Salinibacter sp.]|uniref:hypothetical protein n=1 Tax=Salinibacter sp. TaxID=2065818 RepID=UPI0035D527A2
MGWPALTDVPKALDDADFEGESIVAVGTQVGADAAVTRTPEDFRDGPLMPYLPEEVLNALG